MIGKIEWLASFGSLIRLDAISLGLAPNQQSSTVLWPSLQSFEGEKIRKEEWEKEKPSLTNTIDLKVKEVKKKAKRVENRKIGYAWWIQQT